MFRCCKISITHEEGGVMMICNNMWPIYNILLHCTRMQLKKETNIDKILSSLRFTQKKPNKCHHLEFLDICLKSVW